MVNVGGAERAQHQRAVVRVRPESDERERLAEIRHVGGRGNPFDRLGPEHLVALRRLDDLDQREVEIAAAHKLRDGATEPHPDVQPDHRVTTLESSEQGRDLVGFQLVVDAEVPSAFELRLLQAVDGIIVRADNLFGMNQEFGAEFRQRQVAPVPHEKRRAEALFEPLHFPAHCRLREVELRCGPGDAAAIDDCAKRAQ